MAIFQQQSWGACGKLRDLDYVNPRPAMPSKALPPEVRRRLGLERSASTPPGTTAMAMDRDVYCGAAHAPPKCGESGAGTNWHNPNGHAFVRKGSGLPTSQRASRRTQLAAGALVLAPLPPSVRDRAAAAGRSRAGEEGQAPAIPAPAPAGRVRSLKPL